MRLLVSGFSRWKEMSLERLVAPYRATGQETSDRRRLPCHTGRADRRASLEFAGLWCPRGAVLALVFLRSALRRAMGLFPENSERKRPYGTYVSI